MLDPNLSATYEFIQIQLDDGQLSFTPLSANLFLQNHPEAWVGVGVVPFTPTEPTLSGKATLFLYCPNCRVSLDHTNKPYKGLPRILPYSEKDVPFGDSGNERC